MFKLLKVPHSGAWPIYTSSSANATSALRTKIKRVEGSLAALQEHLKRILPIGTKIVVKEELGQVIIGGNHARLLKKHFDLNKFEN